MGRDRDRAPAFEREPPYRLGPEAVTCRTDPGDAVGLEGLYDIIDDRPPGVDAMLSQPRLTVEIRGVLEAPRVALEDVGHYRAVAVSGKVIREQLCDYKERRSEPEVEERAKWKATDLVVDEGNAEYVGEEKDNLLFGVVAGWGRDVAFYPRDSLDLA